jgi:hypothetical protein
MKMQAVGRSIARAVQAQEPVEVDDHEMLLASNWEPTVMLCELSCFVSFPNAAPRSVTHRVLGL